MSGKSRFTVLGWISYHNPCAMGTAVIAEALGLDPTTVKCAIRELIATGAVKNKGTSRYPIYQLARAVGMRPLPGRLVEGPRQQPLLSTNERKKGDYSPLFLAFWDAYPKKAGDKKKAWQYWRKGKLDKFAAGIMERLAIQIKRKAEIKEADPRAFVPEWPYPQKWIREQRWHDEL